MAIAPALQPTVQFLPGSVRFFDISGNTDGTYLYIGQDSPSPSAERERVDLPVVRAVVNQLFEAVIRQRFSDIIRIKIGPRQAVILGVAGELRRQDCAYADIESGRIHFTKQILGRDDCDVYVVDGFDGVDDYPNA